MYTYIVIVFVIGCSNFVYGIRQAYPSCKQSDICVRLTECRPYMKLIASLRRPLSRSAVLFLRRQECGFDGFYPMVCCYPADVDNGVFVTTYQPIMQSDGTSNNNDETVRPDLTPSDLSEYKQIRGTQLLGEYFDISKTTTTEKSIRLTRSPRRKIYYNSINQIMWNYVNQSSTQPPFKKIPAKKAKREQIQRKMEAINNAFAFSDMDFFIARRMPSESKTTK